MPKDETVPVTGKKLDYVAPPGLRLYGKSCTQEVDAREACRQTVGLDMQCVVQMIDEFCSWE